MGVGQDHHTTLSPGSKGPTRIPGVRVLTELPRQAARLTPLAAHHCPHCWCQPGSCVPPPPPPPPRRPAAQALPLQARLRREGLRHTQVVYHEERQAECAAAVKRLHRSMGCQA